MNFTTTKSIKQIAAGGYHGLILLDSGDLYATGDNRYGQLGDNTVTNRFSPVSVLFSHSPIIFIQAGSYHSIALTQNMDVITWGFNENGQLVRQQPFINKIGRWNINKSLHTRLCFVTKWRKSGQDIVKSRPLRSTYTG
jgi:alpha-tubulin suppressor-like RCC1 family protein